MVKGLAVPSKKEKLLFWIILGSLSTFFAEVVSGSYMFWFDAWGLFMVFPLYTLHILVLATVVFRYRRPSFYALFLAGAIFGMYEAYITKVLWVPTWGPPMISIAGVAVIELIVLVFAWHAFMSFLIPLLVAENSLTKSREISHVLPSMLKSIIRERPFLFIIFLTLFSGLIQSANSPSVANSFISGASNLIVIGFLYLVWNRSVGKKYELRDLLPGRTQFRILLGLLIIFYVFAGISLRPEMLPGLVPQLVILGIYAVLFAMLHLHLKKPVTESKSTIQGFTPKMFISIFALFTLFATGAELLLGSFSFIMAIFWLLMAITGIAVFTGALKDLF